MIREARAVPSDPLLAAIYADPVVLRWWLAALRGGFILEKYNW